MIYSGKTILIFLVILMLAVSQVFALDSIDFNALQSAAIKFSEEMIEVLPFNSSIGLNWSDAYIGSFPHFGIGLTAGAVTMDNKAKTITYMLNSLGLLDANYTSFLSDKFLLPAYSLDARIGIPAIPVDVGVKFGYLPANLLASFLDVGIKNMLIGADVRYVIVNSKVLPMRLSVGLGFNFLNGGISKKFTEDFNFTGGVSFTAKNPTVDVIWRTVNIEFKTQASFPYKILTPYIGAGVSYSWSKAGYEISASGLDAEEEKIRGLVGVTKVSKGSFETIINKSCLNTRVFGGLSFNLVYVRLDLTGMYEIFGGNFGATLGLRFQM
jgi:hypothetical protein